MVESPVWLERQKGISANDVDEEYQEEEQGKCERQIPFVTAAEVIALASRERLLNDNNQTEGQGVSKPPPTTILGLFTSPLTRKGLRIVLITQIAQQASGINAVLYYSTDIMKNALPTNAGYIALLITAVNLVMTFPAILLINVSRSFRVRYKKSRLSS